MPLPHLIPTRSAELPTTTFPPTRGHFIEMPLPQTNHPNLFPSRPDAWPLTSLHAEPFIPGSLPVVGSAFALAGERISLWPEGKIPDFQEHQIAALKTETRKPGFKPDEHRMPYIKWHEAPAMKNGGCVLLIRGGGYNSLVDSS